MMYVTQMFVIDVAIRKSYVRGAALYAKFTFGVKKVSDGFYLFVLLVVARAGLRNIYWMLVKK